MSDINLLGSDGKTYAIPEENKTAALSSGQFREIASAPQSQELSNLNGPSDIPDQQVVDQPLSQDAIPEEEVANKSVSIPKKVPVIAPPATVLLKDAKTGQDVEVPEAQADKLVASGSHTATDIPLMGSDGKLYQIPDDKIPAALQSGQFRLSTLEDRQEEKGQEARQEEVEKSGLTGLKPIVGGSVDAALGFAGKHSPFYQIANEASSDESKKAGKEAFSQVEEEHPFAADVGAVGSEVLSAYSLGKAAEATTKALKLSGLAKVSAEGAIYSAEPVIKSLINKDPAGAAENLALGVGINWGFHGLFSGINAIPKVVKGIGEAVSGLIPEVSQQSAENLMGKELGMTPQMISENREVIAPAIKAAGITAHDTSEQVIDKMQALQERGASIGKAVKQLDTFDGKESLIEDNLNKAKEEIRAKLLPTIVEKENSIQEYISTQPESKQAALRKTLQEELEKTLDIDEKQLQKAAQPILDRIDATIKRGTFDDAKKMTNWVWKEGSLVDNGNVKDFRSAAYGIIKENLVKAEDEAAQKIGGPEIIKGLQEDRAAYGFFKLLEKGLGKVDARVQAPANGILQPFHMMRHSLPIMIAHMVGVPGQIAVAGGVGLGLVKKYLSNETRSASIRKLIGESAQPATDVILHATQTQDKLISDSASNLIKSFVSTEAPKAISAMGGSQNAVKDFLPDGGAGLSHDQQLKQLRTMVNESSNDPTVFAQRMSKVTEPLIKEGLPEVAEAYTNHQLRLMKVIQTVIPADTSMAKAHPFSNNVEEPEISAATKDKYNKALTIASDPIHLLEMIKNNTITAGDVAIAAATNPSTLQKMRNALINEAMKSKPDLSYQHQLSLEIMMGENIDSSTDTVPVLQGVYPPVAPLGGGPSGGGRGKGHMSSKSQNNIIDSYKTISQRSQSNH